MEAGLEEKMRRLMRVECRRIMEEIREVRGWKEEEMKEEIKEKVKRGIKD